MKENLERTGDYNKKIELEDSLKEKKEFIQSLKDEINILDNDLIEHEICIQEQKEFNKEKEKLKNEIKESKDNNKNLKKHLKKKLKKLNALMFGEEINEEKENEELGYYENEDRESYYMDKNLRIIKRKKKDNNEDKNNSNIIEKKPLKKINLKTVESKIKNSMINSIITEEFKKKLEEIMGSDSEQLIKKIKEVENRRKKLEIKNKKELNELYSNLDKLEEDNEAIEDKKKNMNLKIKY